MCMIVSRFESCQVNKRMMITHFQVILLHTHCKNAETKMSKFFGFVYLTRRVCRVHDCAYRLMSFLRKIISICVK